MLYLENFQSYLTDIRVYPYRIVYPLQMESIEFAPITIFYGSNGSGKSTLLNIIAESVGVQDKTLGNTNEYFSEYVRKCTYTDCGIPDESMMIRSEDIMEQISTIRKKNAATDKMVKGWFRKGLHDASVSAGIGSLYDNISLSSEYSVYHCQSFSVLVVNGGGAYLRSRLTSISCQRMVPIREYEGLLSTLQKV